MREMSVTEQRYKAVLAVIGDGRTISEVATDWGVSRRTMHGWLARYEGEDTCGKERSFSFPQRTSSNCPEVTEEERNGSVSVEKLVGRLGDPLSPLWSRQRYR